MTEVRLVRLRNGAEVPAATVTVMMKTLETLARSAPDDLLALGAVARSRNNELSTGMFDRLSGSFLISGTPEKPKVHEVIAQIVINALDGTEVRNPLADGQRG